jgi:hypothetical protein
MKKITITTLAAATIAAAALGLAAPAQADSMSYIEALNAHGIQVYDIDLTLQWGHDICAALPTTNGEQVAENFYRITNGDVPNMANAETIVVLAAQNLCPSQWHGGSATAVSTSTTSRFS